MVVAAGPARVPFPPWGVGADSNPNGPWVGGSAVRRRRALPGGAADSGPSWEGTLDPGRRGERNLPRWHQLCFLIASSLLSACAAE